MMKRMTAMVEAAGKANDVAGKRRMPAAMAPANFAESLRQPLSSMLMPAFGRITFLHFWTLASRRRAAVGLAARLYEVDHGRRPATVADLVPGYLEAAPLDPMVDDGSVIGLPTWCVEEEGESEDESEATTEETPKPKDD